MSFSRQHPGASETKGPSDELLAVDAASEIRSLTLLYDRYADRLYRFFLVYVGDAERAERLLRRLLEQLPDGLRGYDPEQKTFAGWLFARASTLVRREDSLATRITRGVSRIVPGRSGDDVTLPAGDGDSPSEFDEVRLAMSHLGQSDRQAIGVVIGARLSTVQASEAMRLPASLVDAQVERAVRSLAAELSVSDVTRFRDDLASTVQHQALSADSREAHLALIHRTLRGEFEPASDEPARAPLLQFAGLVVIVLVGLGVIWVWGEITTGDTRQHDIDTVSDAGSGGGVDQPAAAADPSPTPSRSARGASAPVAEACRSTDGIGAFHRFVSRFNAGDFSAIGAMLPSEDYEHPLMEVDPVSQERLQSVYRHHDARLASTGEFTTYLRERYAAGERWDVLESYAAESYRNWGGDSPLAMYRDWKKAHPGLSMVIVSGMRWLAPDGQEEIASGQVVVDCEQELIIQWTMRRNDDQTAEPVGVDRYMAAMAPLGPGETRMVRARVRAEHREDGGGLSIWEAVLTESRSESDRSLRQVMIRTLDGAHAIGYVEDGTRWLLDWRGWVVSGELGDRERPMPEEIAQSLPLLGITPELIDESRAEVEQARNVTLTREAPDVPGQREEIEVRDGNVVAIRRLQDGDDGVRVRSEMTLLEVNRSSDPEAGLTETGIATMIEQRDVDGQRYTVPADRWPELHVISMNANADRIPELYRLSWNDVRFDLAVWPSRGGVDLASLPASEDESWETEVTRYRHGPLVWAYRQFTGYPTDALWDDGRYRFELVVDRESVEPEGGWDLRELISLANALSGSLDQPALVRDRGRGRSSRYPLPSMFNH